MECPLVASPLSAKKHLVQELFDMRIRSLRRDRAARVGPELFLLDRSFEDCLDRLALVDRRFDRALLLGCPDIRWRERLEAFASQTDVRDPGPIFARWSDGEVVVEDAWSPPAEQYDLVLAIGTLDTVNDLPLALRLIRHAMRSQTLLIGAIAGGDTLPQLRKAMRAADAELGLAAPHVHPRIEPAALAPLLIEAGLVDPVVDIDRVPVSYPSLGRLISDLRRMAATNVLSSRPHFLSRAARAAAERAFMLSGENGRTVETFEVLNFAAWTK